MSVKLGISIDYITALMRAGGASNSDILTAEQICLGSGADLIIINPCRSGHYVNDADLLKFGKGVSDCLQLVMTNEAEMEKTALKIKPFSVCLIPRKNKGNGYKNIRDLKVLEKTVTKLNKAGIGTSLFIEPVADIIRIAHKIGVDTVELCTRKYSQAAGRKSRLQELENLEIAAAFAHELKLHINAGGGLNYHNIVPIVGIENMECINAGFSVVSKALFVGLDKAVIEMKGLIL